MTRSGNQVSVLAPAPVAPICHRTRQPAFLLVRAGSGAWRIQTLWRDRDALDEMRAATEAPAAPQLFRSVGADPSLEIFEVLVGHAFDE
jgi:hypothetical protein